MGIKDLNALIKSKKGNAFTRVSLNAFYGYAIAIDASLWAFANKSTAQREVINHMIDVLENIDESMVMDIMRKNLIGFMSTLTKHGITPVWVLDGDSYPEKIQTKTDRGEKKDDLTAKIENEKSRIRELHPLARNPNETLALKKLMVQYSSLPARQMNELTSLLDNMGFSVIQSPNEAEKTCSNLAREGKVIAVWSSDTDNYAFGTPILIKGFDGIMPDRTPAVEIGITSHILSALEITHPQFIDLCIMLGCDFNNRIPGFGMVRCLKIITEYGNIDNASEHIKLDWGALNHIRCREIFQSTNTGIDISQLKFKLHKYMEYASEHGHTTLSQYVPNLKDIKTVTFS